MWQNRKGDTNENWYHNYCAFHKHANSKFHKPTSHLCFSLPSIIITITSNEPGNTETHKTDQNPPITNHKPWPFEPIKAKFCFLRGLLRWLTAAKNAIVSWILNFRIRMFVKSAVKLHRNIPSGSFTESDLRKIGAITDKVWWLSRAYECSPRRGFRAFAFVCICILLSFYH